MTGSVYTATLLEDQARRAEVADMMRAGDWRGVINTFQVQWGTAEVSYRHSDRGKIYYWWFHCIIDKYFLCMEATLMP